VSKVELESSAISERQTICQLVVSNELLRHGGSDAFGVLSFELKRAVALATDASFLETLTEATGVTTLTSSGTDADDFASDLEAAVRAVASGATSRLFAIMPAWAVKRMALARGTGGSPLYPNVDIVAGGSANGLTVIGSDVLETDLVVFDGRQVAVNVGTVALDSSGQADIQLDDNPTDGSVVRTSTWQANLSVLRARRLGWGCSLLRSDAVAVVSDLTEPTA
jgi:hypothetical protein